MRVLGIIDETPLVNEEYAESANGDSWLAPDHGPAAGGIDLLSAVPHELGHLLGLERSAEPDDLRHETGAAGQRRRISQRHVAELFAAWT